jgi:hypothetical protein
VGFKGLKNCFSFRDTSRVPNLPVKEAENDRTEDDGALAQESSSPTQAFYESCRDRSEHERSDTGTAYSDSGGQGPPLFKIETDGDDGRDVDQPKADTFNNHTVR